MTSYEIEIALSAIVPGTRKIISGQTVYRSLSGGWEILTPRFNRYVTDLVSATEIVCEAIRPSDLT